MAVIPPERQPRTAQQRPRTSEHPPRIPEHPPPPAGPPNQAASRGRADSPGGAESGRRPGSGRHFGPGWRPSHRRRVPEGVRDWPPLWRLLYPLNRVPGGLVVMLIPVLLILIPVMVLYSLARSARIVSWRLFGDGAPVREHDPAMARVKRLRTWAAVAVSLVLAASFGTTQDLREQLSDRWTALLVTPWLFIVSAPVVITVLICCSTPERRPVMRAALRRPLLNLACFVGTLALVPGLFVGWAWVGPSRAPGSLSGWLGFACVLSIVWSVLLFLFASAAVTRIGFGLAKVHPAIPALLTGVLVWAVAFLGGLPHEPAAIAYSMHIGGPATVTAIALWEIHRLRTRYGVTLRSG